MSFVRPASSYTSTSLRDPVKLRFGKEGLGLCQPQTLPEYFKQACEMYSQHPALAYKNDKFGNTWIYITYAEYAKQVQRVAIKLIELGLKSFDSVAILSSNCPEYFYMEMAALSIGATVAGIYLTSSSEMIYYTLNTIEASLCLADNAEQMLKVVEVKARLPKLKTVIQVQGTIDASLKNSEGYYSWPELLITSSDSNLYDQLLQRQSNIAANQCALLILTSGTEGLPKAVMLSHDSLIYQTKALAEKIPYFRSQKQIFMSYLPLNHIASQITDVFSSLEVGACVYIAAPNSLRGSFLLTIKQVKPTQIFGVPRIYEKIQEHAVHLETHSSKLIRYALQWAKTTVKHCQEKKPVTKWKYWLARKIMQQLKKAMGLNKCTVLLVGGAPLSQELKSDFENLLMPLTNIFGLSETSGVVTIAVQHQDNEQIVGQPLENIEIKIDKLNRDEEGEVCVRGRTVFMGYLNDEMKTKETIQEDGWLRTGDWGYLDEQNNLVLNGRIKELIITSGGENIPALRMEGLLKKQLPCISNALIIGDQRKYLTALLTFKTEWDLYNDMPLDDLGPDTTLWLNSLGLNYKKLSEILDGSKLKTKDYERLLKALEAGLTEVNAQALSKAQRIQYFTVLPKDFSVTSGELGPTLKIKRTLRVPCFTNENYVRPLHVVGRGCQQHTFSYPMLPQKPCLNITAVETCIFVNDAFSVDMIKKTGINNGKQKTETLTRVEAKSYLQPAYKNDIV
uniref:long-chain-fatty-acid--CoA ligase n=1 Tax=Glossina pallidipes TaxID=7398 RepID=A0A1A9ZH60_GLOPL